MIFILLRKIAAPVALIVAWSGVSTFVFIECKSSEVARVEYIQSLALKTDEESEKVEETITESEEIEEIPVETALTRGNVTSRSGSRTLRDTNEIYYEELGISVKDEEVEMLERIVEAEAGGSGYDGMLAVANVVLNRVKYERFPNTVSEVIFANRQFTPISDGRYYKVSISETAKQVVQDALNGARILDEDALYFCTPTAPGKGWFETDLRKIAYIAPHNFYGYK